MRFEESVAAYREQGHHCEYHWVPARYAEKMLAGLAKQLREAGKGARLCYELGLTGPPEKRRTTMWTYIRNREGEIVHAKDGEEGGPYNISWPCPPHCEDEEEE